MLKRMILTGLLAVAAAPALASDASFEARTPTPRVTERTGTDGAVANTHQECQCQHAVPAPVDLPTADGARTNS